jgi:hypothetical protein
MIRLFLKFEFQKLLRYFTTKTAAKLITLSLFIAVFLFVGVGLYYFFLSGFRFVNFSVEQEIQLPLTLFIYELFLVVMAGVIIFSATVSGVFNLFRGTNDNWVIGSPSYRLFPRLVLVKSLLSSSWPLFVMFLPAVLAFNTIYHLPLIGIFFILLSIVLLLVLLNTMSLLAVLLIGTLYYKFSKKLKSLRFSFGGFVTFLFLIAATIITGVWKSVSTVDLVKLFKADNIDVNVTLQNISSHFYFLPTHPVALEIVHWQNNLTGSALVQFLILLALTLATLLLWWKVSVHFYPLWQKFQEGSSRISTEAGVSRKNTAPYFFTGSIGTVLFKKEALVTSRNMKGVLWFLFLTSIWLAQVAINMILSTNIGRYQTDVSEKLAVFQALQFIIAVYFICAFTLRFVFPSFSTEKKTAWILGSAPISFTKIFYSKYLFYTLFFVFIGSVMGYVNVTILNLAFTYALLSMSLFITTVIFIVTLGLSLGALFPSTETDDPEAISTSMPGLFFTALSLIYGGISALILYITLIKGVVPVLVLFEVVTLIFVGIMLLKTPSIVKKSMRI